MKIDVKLVGLDALKKRLQKATKEAQIKADKESQRFLLNVRNTAVNRIKVSAADLGGLANSVQVKSTANGGTVGAYVHYAPYVEFGTGGKVNVPAGLEQYAMQFKGKGIKQINLSARPYLFPAVENHYNAYINSLKKILDQI
jgi:phage gpG-like protein